MRRKRSRQDRLTVQIVITTEGRRLAHVGKRIIVGLLNNLFEPYSEADVDALVSLLQRFRAQMEHSDQD